MARTRDTQGELKHLLIDALDNSYACENALSAEKTCTFRVGKVILQREIPKEQVQKLITTGKTHLLPKFISKKGRPFFAHLKLKKSKVGFEFAEKTPKAKGRRAEKLRQARVRPDKFAWVAQARRKRLDRWRDFGANRRLKTGSASSKDKLPQRPQTCYGTASKSSHTIRKLQRPEALAFFAAVFLTFEL